MAWRFLNRDVSADVALDAVDGLITGLTNVRGFAPGASATLLANKYLIWAEEAETKLAAHFDRSVSRSIQTERYWRIREVTETTPRPSPLIEAETYDQERGLRELVEQLRHYQRLSEVSDDERLLLLDTNVYIHGPMFQQFAWDSLFEEKRAKLLLPLLVIDELDSQKDQGRRAAGQVLKALDQLLPVGSAGATPAQLRDRVRLQVTDEPADHERLRSNDDELTRQARYLRSTSNGQLTVITRDRGLRVRCEAAGLSVWMLPPELVRKDQPDA